MDPTEPQSSLVGTAPASAVQPTAGGKLLCETVLAELIALIGQEAVGRATAMFRHSASAQAAATRAALAAGDLAAAGRHAHTLKSPAAMLGADSLSKTMARIERAARAGDHTAATAAAEGLETLLEQSLASLEQTVAAAG